MGNGEWERREKERNKKNQKKKQRQQKGYSQNKEAKQKGSKRCCCSRFTLHSLSQHVERIESIVARGEKTSLVHVLVCSMFYDGARMS